MKQSTVQAELQATRVLAVPVRNVLLSPWIVVRASRVLMADTVDASSSADQARTSLSSSHARHTDPNGAVTCVLELAEHP